MRVYVTEYQPQPDGLQRAVTIGEKVRGENGKTILVPIEGDAGP
jgi:hypothetical protein